LEPTARGSPSWMTLPAFKKRGAPTSSSLIASMEAEVTAEIGYRALWIYAYVY
jgi:hypothetical protein